MIRTGEVCDGDAFLRPCDAERGVCTGCEVGVDAGCDVFMGLSVILDLGGRPRFRGFESSVGTMN